MDMREVDGEGDDGKGWRTVHSSIWCMSNFSIMCLVMQTFVLTQCYLIHLGCGEPMECDSKMENSGSPDREGAEGGPEGMGDCDGLKGGGEEMEDGKKRKRKPYRPGKLSQFHKAFTNYLSVQSDQWSVKRGWYREGHRFDPHD